MKLKDLKIIIETLEQLGHKDVDLVYADGRDGEKSYVPVRVGVHTTKPEQVSKTEVQLVFSR